MTLDYMRYCRFAFPAIKPPEPFTVARTATLVQEVGDTTAAQVSLLLSAVACLACNHTAVRECPND